MINKKDFIKMAKHVLRYSKGYPDRRMMHPQRDWAIGLLIFSVIVVIGSMMAGNLFSEYRSIDAVEGDAGDTIPQYKNLTVKEALELYQNKKKDYDALTEPAFVPVVEEESDVLLDENEPTVSEPEGVPPVDTTEAVELQG